MHDKARQRIDAILAGNTDILDLSHFSLTELPNEAFSLHTLRVLNEINQDSSFSPKTVCLIGASWP